MPQSSDIPQLSPGERAWLLQLARQSVATAALGKSLPEPAEPGGLCSIPAGVFVTLHLRGELRGCIGQIGPLEPLYRGVMHAAKAAALRDPRFPPLSSEEVEDVEIEISVLSPLVEVPSGEAEYLITIGSHGVMVSKGLRRGLLLPQVPLQYGWNARQLLEQACHKAGLPPDAWQADADVHIFTAEIFAEQRGSAYCSST